MFNILCCTDEKYAPYYGIMLTSLFDNNKEVTFDIYVLTAGLCEDTLRNYQVLASQNNSRIHVITINDEMMKAASIGIASCVSSEELSRDYILPFAYDKRAHKCVSEKVKEAAIQTGVIKK